jgi:hypothetical protein
LGVVFLTRVIAIVTIAFLAHSSRTKKEE